MYQKIDCIDIQGMACTLQIIMLVMKSELVASQRLYLARRSTCRQKEAVWCCGRSCPDTDRTAIGGEGPWSISPIRMPRRSSSAMLVRPQICLRFLRAMRRKG